MSLNCAEINLILEELDLQGSFIQQIVQSSYDSIALYCYKNGKSKTVFISLVNGACRINETRKKVPKSEKPLRFMEFMKANVKGARINSCQQIGLERIIKFDLSHNENEVMFMFVRLWSNSANIIVTDENMKILDVFYRRPNKNEVTGQIFVLPQIRETEKKFEIRDFDKLLREAADFAQSNDGGDPALDEMPRQPAKNDVVGQNAADFATLSFNEKVDLYYSEFSGNLSREALLEQAQKFYTEHKSRMQSAIARLEQKRNEFLASDELKHFGDLILSYGHLIQGESDTLECEDYETGKIVKIKIDPKKSVQENAKKYYEKYKKSVSGLEDLEYDIRKAKTELLDLEAIYESILAEPNPIKIQQMVRKQNKPKQQIQKKHPGVAYSIQGWYILVGRDANENDELLRHYAKGQDMWMHTRDFAGGYIFIKYRPGKTIPLEILLNCGNLAVYHSKARKVGQADLYYTQVKYLRRAKNGPKGLVLPTHEKNITIKIDEKRLKIMEDAQLDD